MHRKKEMGINFNKNNKNKNEGGLSTTKHVFVFVQIKRVKLARNTELETSIDIQGLSKQYESP